MLVDWGRWKRETGIVAPPEPRFVDFTEMAALAAAEKTFYQVGLDAEEARRVLAGQLARLEEMARWIAARVAAEVLRDERVLTDRAFVEGIDIDTLAFDPDAIGRRWAEVGGRLAGKYPWTFDPLAPAAIFRTSLEPAGMGEPARAAGGAGGR
jgi:hypothetical protein